MLFEDQVTPAVGRPDCPLTSTIAPLPVDAALAQPVADAVGDVDVREAKVANMMSFIDAGEPLGSGSK